MQTMRNTRTFERNRLYVGNTVGFWFGVSVINLLLLRQLFAARARHFWKFASKDQHKKNTEHTVAKNNFIRQFRKIDCSGSHMFP